MREETIKIYKFKELSAEAKEKAISKYREDLDFPFLKEDLNEYLKQLLKENKINGEPRLLYSLSYSQGDGVCFTGTFKWKNYHISIVHNGHYVHKRSTDIFMETAFGNDAKEEAYNQFKELYFDLCDKIEEDGYKIIEEEQSDERISETLKINDYEFKENGEWY